MKYWYLFFVTCCVVLDASYAINNSCTTDDNCDLKEKSVCLNQTCQCNTMSKYDEGIRKCLSYVTEYNTLCYEDWQCDDFIGKDSECINNACLCKTGYRWYQGKCQKYANKGGSCNTNTICLDENNPLALECSDNICQCSQGYYDRGEDCRLKSEEGNECAITSDCFPTKNMFEVWSYSHCELGKCIKNSSINETKTRAFNNIFTYSQPESSLIALMEYLENSTTDNPVTKCLHGVSSDLIEKDCLECPNTLYFKKASCICRQGFFLQDGQCIAELGMKDPATEYTADSECPIKPGKVVDGVCYCRNFWFQDSTNRECKKTTLEYTKNCLDNDWCKAMGTYAYCNSTTEKCQCSSVAVLNETSFYCELKPEADVKNICLTSSQCPLYETCVDEMCQCDDGFFRVNETSVCLPEIGYSCEVRDCEHIVDSICVTNETCQCKNDDFVNDGYICVELVNELNHECQIQQQCEKIPHANCRSDSISANDSSKCVCTDEYLDVKGACYEIKGPGSQCSTEFNCTVILGDSFECRNNLCQCPIGAKLNTDNICVSRSNRLIFSLSSQTFVILLVFLWFKFVI